MQGQCKRRLGKAPGGEQGCCHCGVERLLKTYGPSGVQALVARLRRDSDLAAAARTEVEAVERHPAPRGAGRAR